MRHHNALIVFARTPQIARSNSDHLFASLPWEDLDILYTAFVGDILRNACRLGGLDVILYRNPAEISDDYFRPFRQKVILRDLEQTPLSEQIEHAIDAAFAREYQRVLVLLDNQPLIRSSTLSRAFDQLGYEDDCFVVGSTIEGKCNILGMRSNHSDVFDTAEADPLAKPNVLLKRLCEKGSILFPLPGSYLLDSAENLDRLRQEIEGLDRKQPEFPDKSYEMFRMIEKKYRPRKVSR